jgi:type IV pilus assembly protein PilZ
MMTEQRRFARAPMQQPLVFKRKGDDTPSRGIGKDISVGGMYIETTTPAPFGAEVVVVTALSGQRGELSLPGVVRWLKPGGMGVQFSLLGARETHVITELVRLAKINPEV